MISRLDRYSTAKGSGVAWLGDVPSRWDVRRNGRLFSQRNETAHPDLPILEVSLRTGVRVRDFTDGNRKQVLSEKENYKRACAGDIVYNMMRMWQGAVGVAPVDGLVSPAYIVAKPLPGTDTGYYEYLFRTPAYMEEANKFSRGIVSDRNRLYWEDFKQMSVPFPPPEDQAAIVCFLGHVDRRIRHYIRAKQKLIKLLEEQKQAIIHRAVTRGLDPTVRLRPSGVEWLGDVPAHWQLRRIRDCLKDAKAGIWGSDPSAANLADQVVCLRVADFDIPRLSISGENLTLRAVPESARVPRLLKPGDILMEKSGGGDAQPVGRVVIYDQAVASYAISSNFILRLRPEQSIIEPRFLLATLATMQATRRNLPCIKQTTGIQNLDERAYLSLSIGVPPLCEQRQILDQLEGQSASLEKSEASAAREIDLLREYRTRLVADVVTGKLDVREAASRLPNEPEDLDQREAPGEPGEDEELDSKDEDVVAEAPA